MQGGWTGVGGGAAGGHGGGGIGCWEEVELGVRKEGHAAGKAVHHPPLRYHSDSCRVDAAGESVRGTKGRRGVWLVAPRTPEQPARGVGRG